MASFINSFSLNISSFNSMLFHPWTLHKRLPAAFLYAAFFKQPRAVSLIEISATLEQSNACSSSFSVHYLKEGGAFLLARTSSHLFFISASFPFVGFGIWYLMSPKLNIELWSNELCCGLTFFQHIQYLFLPHFPFQPCLHCVLTL